MTIPSADELFTVALTEQDEWVAWNAVTKLQRRGTEEVLRRATELCESGCAVERRVGADVLGQLDRPPRERSAILEGLLRREQDHEVVYAALIALAHTRDRRAVDLAAVFLRHVSADVRYAVAFVLGHHEEEKAVLLLVQLTRDSAAGVRDWATFALGMQMDADGPEVREALADRLDDPDEATRSEAVKGLARRGDRRVLPAVAEKLAAGDPAEELLEGAAKYRDSQLLPILLELRDEYAEYDLVDETLERAIRACSPTEPPESHR